MNFFRQFVHRPQQVWLRKLIFQVHLWAGLIIGIYVMLIGLSGSILVFREELERVSHSEMLRPVNAQGAQIDILTATEKIEAAYPKKKVTFIYAPTPERPVFLGFLREKKGSLTVSIDPTTGKILGAVDLQKSVLSWVAQFHYFLLAGRWPGLMLNGIGAACLLLLTITGIVLWWPGLKSWKRGFWVDFKRSWKRINFDSHNVVGFWTLAIVFFWAVSGVYFAWPRQFAAVVNFFSPVSQIGRVRVQPNSSGKIADTHAMISQAKALSPGTTLAAVSFPFDKKSPFLVYMARKKPKNLLEADYIYFDPATGKHLSTWHRGEANTVGEWVIWSMIPFHFGTFWGLGVKIIWALLGLSLPFLVITGTLMYWNRALSKKWKKLRHGDASVKPAVRKQPVTVGQPETVSAREHL